MRRHRDAMLVLAALAVIGATVLATAGQGAAGTESVPFQIPWIISGGAIGIALIGLAIAAVDIQLRRREEAQLRANTARVMADVVEFIRTEPEPESAPAPRAARRPGRAKKATAQGAKKATAQRATARRATKKEAG